MRDASVSLIKLKEICNTNKVTKLALYLSTHWHQIIAQRQVSELVEEDWRDPSLLHALWKLKGLP